MRSILLALFMIGCGVHVKAKDGTEYTVEPKKIPTETAETPEETDTKETPKTDKGSGSSGKVQTVESVCESAIAPGSMDVAIQRDGHFYETNASIVLEATAVFSSDEDGSERLMYGDNRMWVRVPELIRVVDGRGSDQASICLTIGNVNCSYIWGAKVYELDQCDFGIQPNDILGARFFSLEVHNTDLAYDMVVRAALKALSVVR